MSDSNSSSSLEIQRLSALSDGIFAVAMTLLAFSIHLPESSAAGRLADELNRMCHEGIGLVVSFWIAAMFWLSHLRLFQLLNRADFGFRLLNFALLLSIVVLPISTSFDTTFFSSIAMFVMAGNLGMISLMNLFLWIYAIKRRLLAVSSPGYRGAFLELFPSIFVVFVYALAFLVMMWQPTLGPQIWTSAFLTPLVAHLVRRYFGVRATKQS
jgi:uncharacterized membrane protein